MRLVYTESIPAKEVMDLTKKAWSAAAVAAALAGGALLTQVPVFAATATNIAPSATASNAGAGQTGGANAGPNVQQQVGSQVNDGLPDAGGLAQEGKGKDGKGKKGDGGIDSGPNVNQQTGSRGTGGLSGTAGARS